MSPFLLQGVITGTTLDATRARRRKALNITEIRASGKPLVLVKPADVDALEAKLWVTFPDGYREYVTTLGEGVLGGTFVRVYPPWRIDKELVEWRRRVNKYWFWDKGRSLLPKERALECIPVGDTVNGDELVFHPTRPNRLFVLPRDREKVFVAGTDLLAAVEWMCGSGELVEPFPERNFEPFDSREETAGRGAGAGKVVDPEGESLDDLVDVGKRWAKRHSARKMARKDLKPYGGKDKRTTLLYEAFVTDGEYPHRSCYLAVYRIDDKESGLELGIFRWHKTDDSYGCQYVPNEPNLKKLPKRPGGGSGVAG